MLASLIPRVPRYVARGKDIAHSNWPGRPISTSCVLNAEPPKKKRRIDPAILKVRVEKKIRKYEREIQKLESEPKQLAPILEYQLQNSDIRDLQARPRHTFEEFGLSEAKITGARRLWTFYGHHQSRMMRKSITMVEFAQAKALEKLKALDQDLYDNTVAVDDTILIPYSSSHMRKETAPNPNYTPPDGYAKDITKEWIM